MAQLRTHIDLDEVQAASGYLVGPHTRDCLVAATRALLAVLDAEGITPARYEPDDLQEPWASALTASQPFRPEVP